MIAPALQPLANHLWQSTAFAAAAGLLTLALRKNQAHTRYWLWLAASVKFLVPFSLLVEAGSRFGRQSADAVAPSGLSFVIAQAGLPFAAPVSRLANVPVAAPQSVISLPAVLGAVWLAGFVALVCVWWGKWRRLRAAVRTASPVHLSIALPALTSPAFPEPGIFGIRRPVLLLPGGIAERLAPEELAAILAHELCHVRRRDNLATAVHMAVEAVFWFYPLVWWLGARLIEERERACDEAVLRMGNEPHAYAEGILKVCELYLESPLECVAGVTGSNLKRRIEEIMTRRIARKLDSPRKLLLAAATVAAVAGPLAIGIVNAPWLRAQEQPAKPLAFEVVSIKRHYVPPGRFFFRMDNPGRPLRAKGNRFTEDMASLSTLIMDAYGVADYQISGLPPWGKGGTDIYDVIAKSEGDGTPTSDQLRLMLQTLLADRFQLKLHREAKDLAVYNLVLGKNGSKLKEVPAEVQAPPDAAPGSPAKPRQITARKSDQQDAEVPMKTEMGMLVRIISNFLDHPVMDKTGLKGTYEFSWNQQDLLQELRETGKPAPSIFSVVQQQLGLKLEAAKSPTEVLVIDSVEKPSEN